MDDIDNISLSNCFFLIKYFFGKLIYLVNFSKKFELGSYYHNFLLQCIIKDYAIFFTIFFFVNDVLSYINRDFISFDLKSRYLILKINDMAYFLEKRNTVGLFNLKYPLNIRLNFISGYFNKNILGSFIFSLKLK